MTAPTFDIATTVQRGTFHRRFDIRSDARVVALVGVSGIGKTSLLHAVGGLLRPVSGRIAVGGAVLFDSAGGIDVPAHHRGIGYVFQDGRLFPHLDVASNLRYALRFAKRTGARAFNYDTTVDLLGLRSLLMRRTQALSGGEVQRVAIGRALLAQPRLLLLDEPLSMLDNARREELMPYLQRLRDETRLPMLYVSHVQSEVERIADEVHRVESS